MRSSNNRIHLATKAIFDEKMFPKQPNGQRRHYTPIGGDIPDDESDNGSDSPVEHQRFDDDDDNQLEVQLEVQVWHVPWST